MFHVIYYFRPAVNEIIRYIPFYDHLGKALVIWVLWVVIFRFSNFFKLKACPACGGELKRSKSDRNEKLINYLSLGLLPVKKHRCYVCNWRGLAFPNSIEKKFKPKKLTQEEVDRGLKEVQDETEA